MNLKHLFLTLAFELLLLSTLVSGSFVDPRNTNVTFFHFGLGGGAMLVKDGHHTSCEIAVIDTRSAFVAASCLETPEKGIKTSNYEIYIKYGSSTVTGKQTVRYKIDGPVHIHPKFNKETLANNIAVVEYNIDSNSSLINTTPTDKSLWSQTVYVYRSVDDTAQMKWNAPVSKVGSESSSGCSDASNLYRTNTNALLCTGMTTKSSIDSTCSVPFSSSSASIGGGMYTAALFSHAAILAENGKLCESNGSQIYSYYILLEQYIPFAVNVLKRPVWTLAGYKPVKVSDGNDRYSMNPPDAGTSKKITILSGNLYKQMKDNSGKASSTSSNGMPSSPSSSHANPTSNVVTAQQGHSTSTTSMNIGNSGHDIGVISTSAARAVSVNAAIWLLLIFYYNFDYLFC